MKFIENDRNILDPIERFSETIFGLIMVLTFTGSLSVATAGHQEVRTMVVGAIGCNLAWGIIDAVMYLINGLVARNRGLMVLKVLREPGGAERARGLISDALPGPVSEVLEASALDRLRERLASGPPLPERPRLTGRDFRGALGCFLWVFLTTLPVVLPFFYFGSDPARALRASNAIAVTMLFLSGYSLGRYSGLRPVLLGLAMAAIGAALVALTIALGG